VSNTGSANALKRPPPITAGATIGVFSPSGALAKERLDAGVATLESRGFRVVVAPEALSEWRYFAGTDDERLASFHHMVADKSIDAMMMSRGGYGWSRLIHRVDWQAVANSNKAFCGFSDFTAFNLAALAKANYITFAGPGAATDFDWRDRTAETVADHDFMDLHAWRTLAGQRVEAGPFPHADSAFVHAPQVIRGSIWGSNLSLLTHLVGTPYMPAITGGILFVEEIDEQPYAIERMFLQLFHAGVLQQQKALILGDFTDCTPTSGRFPYAMEHVVEALRTWLPYPVLTGLPFGHVARKLTIPYGSDASLHINERDFSLVY
jgi:muramoyltetrapeptide carboxypeptidase